MLRSVKTAVRSPRWQQTGSKAPLEQDGLQIPSSFLAKKPGRSDTSDVVEVVGARRGSGEQPNAVQRLIWSTARGGLPLEKRRRSRRRRHPYATPPPRPKPTCSRPARRRRRHFWAEWPAHSAGKSPAVAGTPARGLQGRSARDPPSRRGQRCPPAAALGPPLLPTSAAPASLRLLGPLRPRRRRHGPLRRRHEREAGPAEPLPAPALEHHGAVAPESAERDAGQRVVYFPRFRSIDALEP